MASKKAQEIHDKNLRAGRMKSTANKTSLSFPIGDVYFLPQGGTTQDANLASKAMDAYTRSKESAQSTLMDGMDAMGGGGGGQRRSVNKQKKGIGGVALDGLLGLESANVSARNANEQRYSDILSGYDSMLGGGPLPGSGGGVPGGGYGSTYKDWKQSGSSLPFGEWRDLMRKLEKQAAQQGGQFGAIDASRIKPRLWGQGEYVGSGAGGSGIESASATTVDPRTESVRGMIPAPTPPKFEPYTTPRRGIPMFGYGGKVNANGSIVMSGDDPNYKARKAYMNETVGFWNSDPYNWGGYGWSNLTSDWQNHLRTAGMTPEQYDQLVQMAFNSGYPMYGYGGAVNKKARVIVGDRGPEIMDAAPGTKVYSPEQSAQMMNKKAASQPPYGPTGGFMPDFLKNKPGQPKQGNTAPSFYRPNQGYAERKPAPGTTPATATPAATDPAYGTAQYYDTQRSNLQGKVDTGVDALNKAADKRYKNVMGMLEGYGNRQKADVLQRGQNLQSKIQQDMVSRGLTGSTVMPSMQLAGARETNAELARVNENLQRLGTGLASDLSGDQLRMQQAGLRDSAGVAERNIGGSRSDFVGDRSFGEGQYQSDRSFDYSRYLDERDRTRRDYESDRDYAAREKDVDRQYGLQSKEFDLRKWLAEQGVEGDERDRLERLMMQRLAFMERRNDEYPDERTLLNLLQYYGANA